MTPFAEQVLMAPWRHPDAVVREVVSAQLVPRLWEYPMALANRYWMSGRCRRVWDFLVEIEPDLMGPDGSVFYVSNQLWQAALKQTRFAFLQWLHTQFRGRLYLTEDLVSGYRQHPGWSVAVRRLWLAGTLQAGWRPWYRALDFNGGFHSWLKAEIAAVCQTTWHNPRYALSPDVCYLLQFWSNRQHALDMTLPDPAPHTAVFSKALHLGLSLQAPETDYHVEAWDFLARHLYLQQAETSAVRDAPGLVEDLLL